MIPNVFSYCPFSEVEFFPFLSLPLFFWPLLSLLFLCVPYHIFTQGLASYDGRSWSSAAVMVANAREGQLRKRIPFALTHSFGGFAVILKRSLVSMVCVSINLKKRQGELFRIKTSVEINERFKERQGRAFAQEDRIHPWIGLLEESRSGHFSFSHKDMRVGHSECFECIFFFFFFSFLFNRVLLKKLKLASNSQSLCHSLPSAVNIGKKNKEKLQSLIFML